MAQRHQDFSDAHGFLGKEFEKPALLYQINGAKAMPAVFPPPAPTPGASKRVDEENARKRQYEPQRKDGRYMKSFNGINICFDWARNKDGCENTACQNTWHTCGNGVANPIGQWIAHKFQDGSLEINQTREKDVEKAGEGTCQGVADVR